MKETQHTADDSGVKIPDSVPDQDTTIPQDHTVDTVPTEERRMLFEELREDLQRKKR